MNESLSYIIIYCGWWYDEHAKTRLATRTYCFEFLSNNKKKYICYRLREYISRDRRYRHDWAAAVFGRRRSHLKFKNRPWHFHRARWIAAAAASVRIASVRFLIVVVLFFNFGIFGTKRRWKRRSVGNFLPIIFYLFAGHVYWLHVESPPVFHFFRQTLLCTNCTYINRYN